MKKLSRAILFILAMVAVIYFLLSLTNLSALLTGILALAGAVLAELLANLLIPEGIIERWHSAIGKWLQVQFNPSSSDILAELFDLLEWYEKRRTAEQNLLKRSSSGLEEIHSSIQQHTYDVILYHSPSIHPKAEKLLGKRLSSAQLLAVESDLDKELSPDDWGLMTLFASRSEAVWQFLEEYLGAGRADKVERQHQIEDCMDLASKDSEMYQRLLVALSLTEYFPDRAVEMTGRIFKEKTTRFVHHYQWKDYGDRSFKDHTPSERECTVYLTNVTGQTTEAVDLVVGVASCIKSVSFFVVSPKTMSHKALANLAGEYRVPKILIPQKPQFVEANGKGFAIDYLRRVARLLTTTNSLIAERKEGKLREARLYFFVDRYPKVSLRLIENQAHSFLQLFPGCLDIANNLYRFCVEIKDQEIIDEFSKALEKQIRNELANNRVEEFTLDDECYKDLEDQCLEELVKFLCCSYEVDDKERITKEQIVKQIIRRKQGDIRKAVASPDAERIIQRTIEVLEKREEAAKA